MKNVPIIINIFFALAQLQSELGTIKYINQQQRIKTNHLLVISLFLITIITLLLHLLFNI